jgi:hypothetical protein
VTHGCQQRKSQQSDVNFGITQYYKHPSKVHTNQHTEMKDHKHQKASSDAFFVKTQSTQSTKV